MIERGITVCYTGGGPAVASTAEFALALMLAAARDIPGGDASVRAARFQRGTRTGFVLAGKTLGPRRPRPDRRAHGALWRRARHARGGVEPEPDGRTRPRPARGASPRESCSRRRRRREPASGAVRAHPRHPRRRRPRADEARRDSGQHRARTARRRGGAGRRGAGRPPGRGARRLRAGTGAGDLCAQRARTRCSRRISATACSRCTACSSASVENALAFLDGNPIRVLERSDERRRGMLTTHERRIHHPAACCDRREAASRRRAARPAARGLPSGDRGRGAATCRPRRCGSWASASRDGRSAGAIDGRSAYGGVILASRMLAQRRAGRVRAPSRCSAWRRRSRSVSCATRRRARRTRRGGDRRARGRVRRSKSSPRAIATMPARRCSNASPTACPAAHSSPGRLPRSGARSTCQRPRDARLRRPGGRTATAATPRATHCVPPSISSCAARVQGVAAGQVMTTGTFTGLNFARAGQVVRAVFDGVGSAELRMID